jgi:hypothetical protein
MNKEPDLIHEAQYAILALIEELGGAATQIREALADHNNGNFGGAEMCASDALGTLANIERQASEASATIAKWLES